MNADEYTDQKSDKDDMEKQCHQNANTLSPRQNDCAHFLLKGMKCKEIGKELNLSTRTVESYLNHMKAKLECSNRTELIIKLLDIFKHKE